MSRRPLAALLLCATAAAAEPPVTNRVALNGQTFTLPDGFEVELVAGPPLVERPIVADFDDKGRLYVCDSSGSNEKVADQLAKKPHRVVRLEDTDGDGKFDKSTVFVPNVMLPEGAMWLAGSLYVAAPPHILKFTDTDDDGKADKEEVWFDGKTLTGCANDLHGPYRGPDGYIYWCKGAFAQQEYTLPTGKKFTTRAAHIFRARPDGTGLEPVMTGGMDNPVDVAFTPTGDRIFSCTFLQRPGNGKRDGLIHAVYGGVYGKDHDPVYEHPWTGPELMPVLTHLGPAAPCGLHRYEGTQFGPNFANNLFACQFNLRKVSRHVLAPSGSTYRTTDSDFLVSDRLDFHPTDVTEDADGSLLVIDTGGWYKLCCPTTQVVKPDEFGAIYRIRKTGAAKIDDPRGQKIDWAIVDVAGLARLLTDPRPAVRRTALDRAAARPDALAVASAAMPPVPAVGVERSVLAFRPGRLRFLKATQASPEAVWLLTRIDRPEARTAVRNLLGQPDDEVLLAALHAVSLWRDAAAVPTLQKLLGDATPRVRRLAAEALGRVGDKAAMPVLFEALDAEGNDRPLDHALTYALIEIGDRDAVVAGLKHTNPRVRRAVLAALDQMPGGKPEANAVVAELDAADPALKETAWWVAGRYPEWGSALAGRFAAQLAAADTLSPAARDELTDRLIQFAGNEAVQAALAEAVGSAPAAGKTTVLRVMTRSGLKALPTVWTHALTAAAPGFEDRQLVFDALAVFRALPPAEADYDRFVDAIPRAKLWPAGVVPDDYKLAALAARPAGGAVPDATAAFLFERVVKTEQVPVRSAAADVLTRVKLSPGQLVKLTTALKTVGPMELTKLVPAFAGSKDESAGLALVAALADPAVRPLVRAELVKPVLDKYPEAVKAAADKLYSLLAEARKEERDRIDKLAASLQPGDVRRGQAVFNGSKAACMTCHKIGHVGGLVGPDLTKVGGIRTERDLLEAIAAPSSSFVRSYEPVRVVTVDGRAFNGILKKDSPAEVVLAVAADQDVTIPRGDIEEMVPGTVSVMPSGLDQQLSHGELADLIAFLKACK